MEIDISFVECSLCKLSFQSMSELKVHQSEIHTGTDDSTEKPQKRSSQDFQKILEVFPPDQILKMFQMMSDLTKNFEALEKKVEKVLN